MKKSATMIAVIKNVGQPFEVKEVPNDYETLKNTVAGWIEAVNVGKNVNCWINEEGKLIPLPLNFYLNHISIHGNAIFTGMTRSGDTVGLTEDQIAYVKTLLAEKTTAYQTYIDTFFKEKDLPIEVWTYSRDNFVRVLDSSAVIAFLRTIPRKQEQDAIRNKLTTIDFMNGDTMPFLKYIADVMFEQNW